VKSCSKCHKMFRNDGLPIHLARAHGIHPQHDSESESNVLAFESKVCPIPWCGMVVPDLLRHFEESHEDWRLSSGRFVFEVV
jgi:hypothetical protein